MANIVSSIVIKYNIFKVSSKNKFIYNLFNTLGLWKTRSKPTMPDSDWKPRAAITSDDSDWKPRAAITSDDSDWKPRSKTY